MGVAIISQEQTDPHLSWALYYESLGWSVVPVRPGEKLPAVPWAEYQKRRATPAEITAWWGGTHKGCGIGLITGEISGFFVIDIDDKPAEGKDGAETLATLESTNAPLPATTEAITGSGGRHLLFRHPGLGIRIKTVRNIGPGTGLDVRGDGGFIVAAPSLHANGRLYAWSVDAGPEDAPPADPPDWLLDLVEDRADASPAQPGNVEYIRERGPLGLDGATVEDGREAYMRDTVLACLIEYIGENGCEPTPQELYDVAWPQYAAHVDFKRPGRREREMADKCRRALQRFASGRIRGIPDLAAAVAAYQRKKAAGNRREAPGTPPIIEIKVEPEQERIACEILSLEQIDNLPPVRWMIKDWLVLGGMTLIYGPPASLKSFLTLDWLLHIAYGMPWRGLPVVQGAVLYVAGEGMGGISKRIKAWRTHHGKLNERAPFYMTRNGANLMNAQATLDLRDAINAKAEEEGVTFVAVAVDTVARAMVGGDENTAQDMGTFVAACDFIRNGVKCALIAVHHSGKDKERGSRGSIALPGAVDTSIRVERTEDILTVTTEKQKDGEEAEPVTYKAEVIDLPGHIDPVTSLVLVPAEKTADAPRKDFVTVDMATRILRRVHEAWTDNNPYSDSQKAGADKWAGAMMMRQYQLTRGQVISLLGHWRDNGIYTTEERTKAHKGGMRVLKWPGEVE